MRRLRLFIESPFTIGVRLVNRYPRLGTILRPVYRSLRSVSRPGSTKHGIAWLRLILKEPGQIRFFIPWRSSLKATRNALTDEVPWITFGARRWVESFLTADMHVFEFSSGGSTIFLAKRVKTLVSVEHDEHWYELTAEALARQEIRNCQYLLVTPQHADKPVHEPNDPYGFVSSGYPGMSLEEYITSISTFPDESFDLVSIDGRARPSCVLHALDKVRCGGYLMLDNSERTWYQAGKDLLVDWEQRHFYGPGPYNREFWQTSIYRKTGKAATSKGTTDESVANTAK